MRRTFPPNNRNMRLLFLILFQLSALTFFAQGKWTAVMTQSGAGQRTNTAYTLKELESYVYEQAGKGYVVGEVVCYAKDRWYAVATQNKGVNVAFKSSEIFPRDFVLKEWEDGKHISEVTWGNDSWIVIMTTKKIFKKQIYAFRDSWQDMEKWIKSKWDENKNYQVTQLAYGNKKWFGVVSTNENYEPQTLMASEELPTKWIQEKFNERYNITSVESDGKRWYVIMTKKPALLSETILIPETDYPQEKVQKEFDKERRISTLVYSGNKESAYNGNAFWKDMPGAKDATAAKTFDDYSTSAYDKLQKKDYTGAIIDYEKAVALKSTDHLAWNNLAWAKYLKGSCNDALADINKSIALSSTSYNNHTKASILKCQNKCAEALTYFNEAVRLYRIEFGKVDKAIYYSDRAEAKRCIGNYSGAIDDVELALAIEPANAALKTKLKELNELAARK